MKKNLVIVALVVSNLMSIAALIYVGLNRFDESHADANAASAPQAPGDRGTEAGPQEFTFKAPGRFLGDEAPPIANRALEITATFDTQAKDGVIVAQGGLAHGYALFVHEGELLFALRRLNVLTTVSGGKITAGRQTVTATLSKAGELTLARDGSAPATGRAAGTITLQPTDGLDIGADRGAAVGPYEIPNAFSGTIETVTLKVVP